MQAGVTLLNQAGAVIRLSKENILTNCSISVFSVAVLKCPSNTILSNSFTVLVRPKDRPFTFQTF